MRNIFFISLIFLSSCLAPHWQKETKALNQALLKSLNPEELNRVIEEGSQQLIDENKPAVDKIRQLTWVLAGVAGSGVREIVISDGASPQFCPATGQILVSTGMPRCVEPQEYGVGPGGTRLLLWSREEELWGQWMRLAALAHEVAHSIDDKLPASVLFAKLEAGTMQLESLVAHQSFLKRLTLIEMRAEFLSSQLIWETRKRVGKTVPWEELLKYPGAFLAFPPRAKLYWDCPTSEGSGQGFELRKVKTLQEIFEICLKSSRADEDLPYVIGNVGIMILESDGASFDDAELSGFIKACSWSELSQRVDSILAKRTLKECIQKFREGRARLIASLNK